MEKNKRRFIFSVYVQDILAIPLAKLFIKLKVSANIVTFMGLIFAVSSGFLYLDQKYMYGAVFFFAALVFDSTDGRVARGTNTYSKFGAKLDAVADKIRSFFVAFCLVLSFDLSPFQSTALFTFYIILPVIRSLLSRRDPDFYDPTILFWDATPFKDWFVKKSVLGLYTGWERSVLALSIAPLFVYKIEIFIVAVALEQILFFLGSCFFRSSKIGIDL